jgi:hypothetical protein
MDFANDRFNIITCRPSSSSEVYKKIEDVSPELILVDLDLSSADDKGEVIGFNGLTLMTELRQKVPYVPLVLFTKKSLFENHYSEIPNNLLYMLDEIMYKDTLQKSDNSTPLKELYDLAIGYHKLKEVKNRDWNTVFELLEAPEEDYDDIISSAPPGLLKTKYPYSIIEISKWIRKVLLEYPGILYDSLHSATFLGITEEDFLSPPIQDFFSEAKYSGIFTPPEAKSSWWKSKLSEIARMNMNDDETKMPLREVFYSTWNQINDSNVDRSKCIYSGDSPAEWVCHILKKPMMLRNSLLYHPDSRPEIMDEARISFKAIITSNDVNDEMVDQMSQDILKDIRSEGRKGHGN